MEGYSTGAPVSRCDSMTPNHGSNEPQDEDTSPSPYVLNVDKETMKVGETTSGNNIN